MLLDFRDQRAVADDQAGLRAAEQLVAAERDNVCAGRNGFLHGGLVRQPPLRQVGERTATEIDGDRQPVLARERREFGERRLLREAADRVVAAVHLHQQPGARADRVRVVAQVGAVGRADLAQLGAGTTHDVGDAEGAADLDQLAARHDDFLFRCERRQGQQHGRRIVVDDGRRFSARQFAEQTVDEIVAIAAATGCKVEFEVDRLRERVDHRAHRFVGQQRTPEVRVQHGAGQVEHRAHGARALRGQRARDGCGDVRFVERFGRRRIVLGGGAPAVELGAHGVQHARAAVVGQQRLQRCRRQHALDRRHARQHGIQFIQTRFGHVVVAPVSCFAVGRSRRLRTAPAPCRQSASRETSGHSSGFGELRWYPASFISRSSVRLARSSASGSNS